MNLTKHTTPFAARRDLEEQYQKLRATIEDTLNKMHNLHWEKDYRYYNYIYDLKQILPRSADKALTVQEIYDALGYSGTKEDIASIRASLAGLATNANKARINFDFASKQDEDYNVRDHCALVQLTDDCRVITHYYAELDEDGKIIRKWSEDATEPVYWYDEDWDHHINDDDEYDDDDDKDWGEEDEDNDEDED